MVAEPATVGGMRASWPKPPRCHKYGAIRTGGYASKAEAGRAAELRTLQAAGVISELREQVLLSIQPLGCELIQYRADFQYTENHVTVVEDTKGIQTPEFRIKWKLARWSHPNWLFRLSFKRGRGYELKDYPPAEEGSELLQ